MLRNNNIKIQNKGFTVGPDHSRSESGLHIYVKMLLLCLALSWSQLSGKWRREDRRDVAEGKKQSRNHKEQLEPTSVPPTLGLQLHSWRWLPAELHVLLAWSPTDPQEQPSSRSRSGCSSPLWHLRPPCPEVYPHLPSLYMADCFTSFCGFLRSPYPWALHVNPAARLSIICQGTQRRSVNVIKI